MATHVHIILGGGDGTGSNSLDHQNTREQEIQQREEVRMFVSLSFNPLDCLLVTRLITISCIQVSPSQTPPPDAATGEV